MNSLIISLIPSVIFLTIIGSTFIVLKFNKIRNKGKRSPLTSQLLRSPGETLRKQIDDLNHDITFYAMIAPVLPLTLYTTYLSQYLAGSGSMSIVLHLYITVSAALVFYCFLKLWSLLKKRTAYRLGLDCEMAVGQELNQLMLEGYKVFHDFPAEERSTKFNIDHIVISPKGVFAIETKGRAKPDKNSGIAEATVVYDGQSLKFPGWIEKGPIEQARLNAKWFSEWLGKAVGETVQVYPVLALPGWYIERQGAGDVLVFSPKNPQPFFRTKGTASFSEALIKRISYQIEQKCRDVDPTAYKLDKK